MPNKSNTSLKMRIIHRYLGFFLAGIMAVYAISGVILIFRKTDWLKKEVVKTQTIATKLPADDIGELLKIKDFKVERTENGIVYWKNGQYNQQTGEVKTISKKLPFVLDKFTKLHKATNKDPLFFLNIFFGLSLLFFVVSSFWMFLPGSDIFKKGLWFTAGGILLTLILLFI